MRRLNQFRLLIISTLILFSISGAQANPVNEIKEKVRPYIVKFFGAENADKWLGENPNSISMPAIPKVEADARKVTSISDDSGDDKNWENIPKDKRDLYNAFFIKEVFQAVKNRPADDNTIGKWSRTLSQGGSREGVYRAFVLDNDYAGKENFDYPLSDSTIEFAQWYMEKFVNRKVPRKKLEKFNFYSLKRISTEKSLEIVDAFGKDKNKLHNWYAILSADFASKYPKIWKSKTRQNKTKKGHKYWAENMPGQFLKSELIIKVHMVYNHLNQASSE